MMQFNISPETLVEPMNYSPEMRNVIMGGITVDKMIDKQYSLYESVVKKKLMKK